MIPPTFSPLPNEVECEPEATKDKVQATCSGSTAHIQPLVVQVPIPEPSVAPNPNPKSNKEKLFELTNTSLNENCSAVLLKKLPEKLGDPDKFLIPCDFPELEECLALADLGASINLMPLSVLKKLLLLELTPTRMTLELTNRSVSYPVGVAEDVFVKVGNGVSYDGPMIPPTFSPLPNEVECEPEAIKDKVQATCSGSTAHVQPLVIQVPIPEPNVAPNPNPKPLHFDLSFVDALLHKPKFASTFKSLLSNKEKLFELTNTSLNENCSAVLLKKLPEKLGDPDKFLIPCDFPELEECLALANLGASINLMPLSVWKKLLLLELTPTRMTLELANRWVSYPVGVAEDVFVKVGKFHFPADFVVVDYDVDPLVPLILERPFLRMERALIDVHDEELTLQVNDEVITFNVGHTLRYSYRYDDESINQIDVMDVKCGEYAQEVLIFSDSSKSDNPTSSSYPIIITSCSPLTPFVGGDFVLEEIEACLTKDSIPLRIDDADFDPEGDILLLEKLLNDDPSSPLFSKELHFDSIPPGIDDADFDLKGDILLLKKLLNDDPSFPLLPKELHFEELKIIKSSIDDPLEPELRT
nr:reverse transcriptase domain-containing protein [Tanacetum cinerariifolium]